MDMFPSCYDKSPTDFECNPADFRREANVENLTVSELECQTILKQRQELQLLIGELKERDRELNEMVTAHRQQLNAWDKDRHRLADCEKRSTKLESEVKKRNEQLRMLIHRLKISETKQINKDSVIEATQTKLIAVEKAMDHSTVVQCDLKDTNEKLNDSLTDMTDKIIRLESKEQDIITQLQLKNGELVEAESEISELNSKLRRYEAELSEAEEQNRAALGDLEQQRDKFRQCRAELDKTTAEAATKTGEVIAMRQELSKMRDETQKLRKELYLAEEQLKRREEVILLQKSKQHRADSELTQLRQLFERQQEELAILQLNSQSSHVMLAKQEDKLNMMNLSQFELDSCECCSQTTNDLLEEAKRTADDDSFLLSSSPKPSCSRYSLHSNPRANDPFANSRRSPSPSCSPSTSKLQMLLSESRQMAQNLERTARHY